MTHRAAPIIELGSRGSDGGRALTGLHPGTAAFLPSGERVDPPVQVLNNEVPLMSPKREPRFWNRENAPLIALGIGLLLVLIAAGIIVWVINVAPVISRITGSILAVAWLGLPWASTTFQEVQPGHCGIPSTPVWRSLTRNP